MDIFRTFIGHVKGDKGDSAEVVYKHEILLKKGTYNVLFKIYSTSSDAFTKDDIKTKFPPYDNGVIWEDSEDDIFALEPCGILNTYDSTGDNTWTIFATGININLLIYPDNDSFTFIDKISKL